MEKEYNSEEEFINDYDSSQFEKLSMTVDILVLSVSSEETSNYRKTDKKKMSILLVKRNQYPFKDKWCLPGGFIGIDENLDDAPMRVLKRGTNVDNIYLEQLYTFGDTKRDPRMRIVSSAYMALIDKNKLDTSLNTNASWFDVVSIEEKNNLVNIILNNGKETISFTIRKELKEKTTDRYKFVEVENDKIAFDHTIVILSGIERLRNKVEYTDIVFNMMPDLFTLGELQQVYEVILNKKLLDPAFRRIIADKVVKTNKLKTGGGHRPSYLFEYKHK